MNTYFSRIVWLGFALLVPLSLTPSSAIAQSLYIGDAGTAQVVRYNIQTRASEGTFTSGLDFSFIAGLAFGADGSLYTGDFDFYQIAQFDGHTGMYQRTITPFGSGQ